jgi:HD superfamily phosphodiesterase
MQNDLDLLQKELIRRLEEYFGTDRKRIDHAKSVLKYAIAILKEEQADPYIVIPTALLHDAGIKIAEQKYKSAAPKYQEQEGPRVAGEILVDMGYEQENIYEICAIIAHHHTPREQESTNYKVVYDADQLVNLPEIVDTKDQEKLAKTIERIFLTGTGKRMAQELYLGAE